MLIRERIKKVRNDNSLTQGEFAKRIGLTTSTISDIERGKIKTLTDRNVKLISSEFGVNEEWLKSGNGDMIITMDEDSELDMLYGKFRAENDPFKKKLVKLMLNMTDDQIASLKLFIDTLKDN